MTVSALSGPTVTLRYFGGIRRSLGRESQSLAIGGGRTVASLLSEAAATALADPPPIAAAKLARCSLLVAGRRVTDDHLVEEPSTLVDILPPFAGG